MEQYRLTAPKQLNTTVKLPASKSISNRALIIYALSGGQHLPQNLSNCDDTEVIVSALKEMPEEINIKAAGTAMRFMTAYLSVTPGSHVLTGTERMKHRPIGILVDALRKLGADIRADAEWTSSDTITVKPQPYKGRDYYIESDWSGASYWYELLALCPDTESEVRLTGLMDGSKQGDSIARYIFSMLGVKTEFESKEAGKPQTVTLKRNGRCVPRLEYDFVNAPDLAQTFVVTCIAKNIPFHFKGLSTLKIKETDRILALRTELRKLGYVLTEHNGSELSWNGERCKPLDDQGIDTYEDHRMALSTAPFCFIKEGLRINNPQVVTKSYPQFWDDLEAAGVKVLRFEI